MNDRHSDFTTEGIDKYLLAMKETERMTEQRRGTHKISIRGMHIERR